MTWGILLPAGVLSAPQGWVGEEQGPRGRTWRVACPAWGCCLAGLRALPADGVGTYGRPGPWHQVLLLQPSHRQVSSALARAL